MKQPRQEYKEFLALAAWIQTFPEFTSIIYNDENEEDEDMEHLLSLLGSSEVTLYVFLLVSCEGRQGTMYN